MQRRSRLLALVPRVGQARASMHVPLPGLAATAVLLPCRHRATTQVRRAVQAGDGSWQLQPRPLAQLGTGRVLGGKFDRAGDLWLCDGVRGLVVVELGSRPDRAQVVLAASKVRLAGAERVGTEERHGGGESGGGGPWGARRRSLALAAVAAPAIGDARSCSWLLHCWPHPAAAHPPTPPALVTAQPACLTMAHRLAPARRWTPAAPSRSQTT
jgi:hypothetical protein